MDSMTIPLQLGVFAASLVLAGVAALMSRPIEVQPDWPPSSRPVGRSRRAVALTIGAGTFFVAGSLVALVAVVVAIL